MNAAVIGTIVRSLLITLGGIGVTKGYYDNDTLTQVAGALTTVITAAWGVWEKKRRDPL